MSLLRDSNRLWFGHFKLPSLWLLVSLPRVFKVKLSINLFLQRAGWNTFSTQSSTILLLWDNSIVLLPHITFQTNDFLTSTNFDAAHWYNFEVPLISSLKRFPDYHTWRPYPGERKKKLGPFKRKLIIVTLIYISVHKPEFSLVLPGLKAKSWQNCWGCGSDS